MLERCLGATRSRKLRRAVGHAKLTLLCLVVTVVVLRGTIGAGNYGTPEQDLLDIHDRFYRSRDLLLEEDHRPASSAAPEADEEKPGQPGVLGPRVSGWDEERSRWLAKNPSNVSPAGKPRVLLVTGSSPKPCENRLGDHYLLKSIKNKIDYCRLHGVEIFYGAAALDAEMSGFWSKLPLVRALMLSRPEVELIWWLDSDAMFTDMTFEIPWERYKDHNLVMHGWSEMVYGERSWVGLNTGSFLIRNCQWSLDILEAWAPMGKGRDEAGKFLSRELKDRPAFEADDQSAMVYLLASQRERWGEKVYLENEYYLHGFWGILVDRLEEMDQKEGRRPLVTHFVGCKPCGYAVDYTAEKCLKGMDKAFNFGDNQVLGMLGFRHVSLDSEGVERLL